MINNRKVIVASLWVVGIFGLSQLLRLGSNLVVTRLLAPEMFGIMAIVYAFLQGLAMFSDLGLWVYVVRHKEGTNPHMLNTIWTIQVVRGWLMFVTLVTFVLLFEAIKNSLPIELTGVYALEELPVVLTVIGFTAVINGHVSMAPAIMSRELKRGRLELIELLSQFLGASIMILWAWLSPTIWALVSAGIAASIANLLLTYFLLPYRHTFSWDKAVANDVFQFGKWIVLASALTFMAQQGDRLFFGAYISPAQLGVYSIAFFLITALSAVVQNLVAKIWFPVMSSAFKEGKEKLKEVYYSIRFKQDFLLFTITGVLIAIAPEIINILYDQRYNDAGWIMQILAISIFGHGLSMVGMECLSAYGSTKYRVKLMFYRAAGLLLGLPLSFHYFGLEGAVFCVALNVFFGLPTIYFELYKNSLLSLYSELRLTPTIFLGYLVGSIFL